MRQMIEGLYRECGERWCRLVHPVPMWPAHGRYRCRTCHRTYPVPWEKTSVTKPEVTPQRSSHAPATVLMRAAGLMRMIHVR